MTWWNVLPQTPLIVPMPPVKPTKGVRPFGLDGSVIIHFDGPMTREQIAEVKAWWANPAVRAAYLPAERQTPNRLYGAQINADGDAV